MTFTVEQFAAIILTLSVCDDPDTRARAVIAMMAAHGLTRDDINRIAEEVTAAIGIPSVGPLFPKEGR